MRRLRGLGFQPIDRLKTIGTLIDKLQRERRSSLKTVHDLAGARVVLAGDLKDQDAAASAFIECCAVEAPAAVIDRRVDPRAGYRAVHVIPIRYGGDPADGARDGAQAAGRSEHVASMMQVSKVVAAYEEAQASTEVRDARAWLSRRGTIVCTGGAEEIPPERRAICLAYEASSDRAEKASYQLLTWMAQVVVEEERSR
jgi:hypothetical protein